MMLEWRTCQAKPWLHGWSPPPKQELPRSNILFWTNPIASVPLIGIGCSNRLSRKRGHPYKIHSSSRTSAYPVHLPNNLQTLEPKNILHKAPFSTLLSTMLIDVFHKPRNTGLTSPSPGFLGEGWTGEPYIDETGKSFQGGYLC